MKIKALLTLILCTFALGTFLFARSNSGKKEASAAPMVQSANPDTMRIEGENRFHANCGRCHAVPQKFPPRIMATVIRHMRVRATITEDDQRLILFYMTQ